MDIMNIQALIAQGFITDVASIDPNKAYLAVGIFQPGNRQSGSANNAYATYAISIGDLLAAGGVYTASNGITLVGNDFQLASQNVSQFINDANYVAGTGTIGYVPRWNLTDVLGNSAIFDNGLGHIGINTITPHYALEVAGVVSSNRASLLDPTTTGNKNLATRFQLNPNAPDNNGFAIGVGAVVSGQYPIWFSTGESNGGGYDFYIGTVKKMSLDNNGDFLLGTNTSNAKLNIKGTNVSAGTNCVEATNSLSNLLYSLSNDGRSIFNYGASILGTNFGHTFAGISGYTNIFTVGEVGLSNSYLVINSGGSFNLGNVASTKLLNFDNTRFWFSSADVGIGTTNIVYPSARLHVIGVDSTSSNYALKVENSASSPLLYVRNDGVSYFGGNTVINTNGDGGLIANCTFSIVNNRTNAFSIYNSTYGPILNIDANGKMNLNGSLGAYAMLEITAGSNQGVYATSSASICFNGNETSGIAVKGYATTGIGLQGYIGSTVGYALKLDDNVNGVLLMKVGSNGTKSIINAVNLPTSNAGLSTGDLYVDTAANILANGDKVVGWKV